MGLVLRKACMIVVMMSVFMGAPLAADTLRIAVASNFMEPARELVRRFEQQSTIPVSLSFGSSGKLYAQIRHGAPFTLFMSADRARPQLLEQQGVALTGTRFTYAYGRLVLWSADNSRDMDEGRILQNGEGFAHLAIANPRLAPYGRATKEVLQALELWPELQPKMVRGENIGQTFQFVRSGNAQLGFVAMAQLVALGESPEDHSWLVPESLHSPIEQQAVLLKNNEAGIAFVNFLKTPEATAIIAQYGYRTAGTQPDD